MSLQVSLVALFYNEEASVETVIREGHGVLKQMGVPFEIVAVQNGSLDRTPEILARLQAEIEELRIVVVEKNQGAGYGALVGLYSAIGEDVVGVPGDGQVDLTLIPKMYEFKRQCGADIAYGRRTRRPDGWTRALISRSYNFLMRTVFGLRSKDVNGPPKVISRTVLDAMRLKSTDQFLECEMMLKAERMGLTMCSIDVDFQARQGGTSSIGWRDCRDYLRNLLTVLISRNDPWGIHAIAKSPRKAKWIHQGADAKARPAAAFAAVDTARVE
jgi:glycosyltransferase involved in cell wall biosynthesis